MGDTKTPVIAQVIPATELSPVYTRVIPSSRASGRSHSGVTSKINYYRRYKKLKRFAKDLIFQNASICDEVEKVEQQINSVRDETRCLLKRVLHYEQESESPQKTDAAPGAKVKRKVRVVTAETPAPADTSLPTKPKVKRTKGGAVKKTVPSIPLDEFGRPVLPLEMGELTVHSLGEIDYDRASFHCGESIYPVGFCSTRVYASSDDIYTRCLYTCKISDIPNKPFFEISPEENPDDIHSGDSPSECLSSLTQSLSLADTELRPSHTDGLAFFGLTHPVVQNLIQSCPGAKKCGAYRWVKFEINRELAPDKVDTDENTPTVSYQCLLQSLADTDT